MNDRSMFRSDFRQIVLESSKHSRTTSNSFLVTDLNYTNFLPKFFCFHIKKYPSSVFLLLLTAFQLLVQDETSQIIPPTVLILLPLILYDFLKNFLYLKSILKCKSAINSYPARIWEESKFVEQTLSQVTEGDFVLVKRGEVVPADLVILAINSGTSFCCIDESNLFGRADPKKKKPIKEIQEKLKTANLENLHFHIRLIQGQIKFSPPNSDLDSFKGFYKAYNSPTSFDLDIQNFVMQGTVLDKTEWLLGLAVYCGYDTKLSLNSYYAFGKLSPLDRGLRAFCIAMLSLWVVFLVVHCSVLQLYNSENILRSFQQAALVYSGLVPSSLVFLIFLIKTFFSRKINRENKNVQVLRSDSLETLGNAEYLLVEKGVLNKSTSFEVNAYLVKENSVSLKFELEKLQTSTERTCNSLSFDLYDFSRNNFLIALTVCNKFAYDQEASSLTVPSVQENSVISLANSLGCAMETQENKYVFISCLTEDMKFEVVALQNFEDKKTRIVLRNIKTKQLVLYVKGSKSSMDHLIESNTCEVNFYEEGALEVYYGCKILEFKEAQNLELMYKIAMRSPVNRKGRIKAIFENFEKNLNFLGVVSIKDSIREKDLSTIEVFKDASIKFWVFGDETEDSSRSLASTLGLSENCKSNECFFKVKSKKELKLLLKEAIKSQIQFGEDRNSKSFSGSKYLEEPSVKISSLSRVVENSSAYLLNSNYGIHIDNVCTKLGSLSKKCNKYLFGLLLASNYVVFCGLEPFTAYLVSRIFSWNFKNGTSTLSIGKSTIWNGVMQKPDLVVRVQGDSRFELAFTDIKLKSFSDLRRLVLVYGQWFNTNISKVVCLDAYKNFVVTTLVFTYQFYCEFSGTSVLSHWDSFFLIHVFLGLPLVVEGVFAQNLTEEQLLDYPQIHESSIKTNIITRADLVLYCALGLVHGVILGALNFIFAYDTLSSEGFTESFDSLNVTAIGSVALTLQITFLISSSSINLLTLVAHLISFVLLVALLSPNLELALEGITSNIFVVVLSPLVCFIVTYLTLVIKQHKLGDLKEIIKLKGRVGLIKSTYSKIDNYSTRLNRIIKEFLKKMKKNSFEKFDMNFWTLKFKSKKTEQEYKEDISVLVIRKYRIIYFILTIFMIVVNITTVAILEFFVARVISLLFIGAWFGSVALFSASKSFKRHYTVVAVLTNIVLQVVQVFIVAFTDPGLVEVPMVVCILFNLALDVDWLPIIAASITRVLVLVVFVTKYFQETYTGDDQTKQTILFLIKMLGIETASAIALYNIELQKRKDFQLRSIVQDEMRKTNSVLTYILPEFVRKRVKEGVRYIAEDRGTVSILFCNINEFDRIVATYSPQELTKFLDKTFRKFDELCEKVGMTKVETVGYTYMACAGLTDSENELNSKLANVSHARRAVEMAIGIKNECQNVFLMDGSELEVKIGIHSGEVAAGVVGSHKPQFSLVGDTVNTASRMATTAVNSIQISKATYDLLEDTQGLNFKPLIVFVKGKGDMQTYELELNTHRSTLVDLSSKKKINIASFDSIQPFGSEINSYTSKKTTRVKEQEPRLNTEVETRSIRMCSLSLKETPYEKQFRLLTIFRKKKSIYFALVIYLVCCFGDLFVMLLCMAIDGQNIAGLFVIQICKMSFVVVLLLLKKKYYEKYWFGWVLQGGYFLIYLMMLLEIRLSTWYSIEVWNSSIFYDLLIFCQCSQLFFKHVIMSAVLAAVLYMGELALMGFFETLAFSSVFLSIYLSVIITSLYYREKLLHVHTLRNQEVQREKQKTESLLMKMMPPHAYTNLREENNFVDTLYDVTLMYADIVGFTQWSSGKEPIQVVEMLSKLFDRFDKVCEEFGVYKVHTIGDCYVVMGNLSNRDRNPSKECLNMVMFAQRIIESIKEVNANYGMELGMRIGMNTGEVIGGIAGTNIVRYDIYGADVLVANKVESNGISGAICISEKSKNYLEMAYPNQLSFEFHKKVPIPSIYQEVNIYIAKFS